MFIYTLRASTLKFFCAVGLAVITLAVLILFVPTYSASAEAAVTVDYSGIRTNEDRVKFFSEHGYTVTPEPIETVEFTLPAELDRVLTGYNEIQKTQGLDLSRYLKKSVTRYTYEVKDYPGYGGKVYANLVLCRDRIIAVDICSADPSGFVHGISVTE